MICKVIDAIERFSMLDGKTVVVGLSGGADSVALLNILYTLREKYSIKLSAAHINHCLRGDESERDELFVRRLCESMNIPLTVKRADVSAMSKQLHIGLEECGRQVRYDFFQSLGTEKIATAHTLSDSIETMMINLSRGCSLSGLCSIPPVRGKIIRPLILCTSDEVRQYCKDNGLEYVTDSSNLTDEYMRNRVRHTVIPAIKTISSSFETNAGRCLDSLRDDNELLNNMTSELLSSAKQGDGYNAELLKKAPLPILRRAVYSILYEQGGVMPERKHIDALISVLDGSSAQLNGGLICRCRNGLLTFPKEETTTEQWQIKAALGLNETPYSSITLMKVGRLFYSALTKREQGTLCFDYDKTQGVMLLRSRLSGDKLTDAHRGNTKTLKKLFTEVKMPAAKRNEVAVLCDEHGMIWTEGFCVDARCAVSDKSENIIYIKCERT